MNGKQKMLKVKVKKDQVLQEIKMEDVSFTSKKFINKLWSFLNPDTPSDEGPVELLYRGGSAGSTWFGHLKSWPEGKGQGRQRLVFKDREDVIRVAETFGDAVRGGIIPDDITPSQQGAALNWIKGLMSKSPSSLFGVWDAVLADIGGRGRLPISTYLENFFQWGDNPATKKFLTLPKRMPALDPATGARQPREYVPMADINKIESIRQLERVVKTAAPEVRKYQEKQQYKDAELGMNKIYENSEWEVFIPENRGAACELGKGTDWCTAAKGTTTDYYAEYHKPDDPLFVFINKENPTKKYQFHYGTSQFMDKHDNHIIQPAYQSPMTGDWALHQELHGLLVKAGMDKKYPNIFEKQYWKDGDWYEIDEVYIDNPRSERDGALGSTTTRMNGLLHSIDGKPALIRHLEDQKIWYSFGEIDRIGKPAFISPGTREWRRKGRLHNMQGPAIVRDNGDKEWWLNGYRQPLATANVIKGNGTKEWHKRGGTEHGDHVLHRTDGPAIIRPKDVAFERGLPEWVWHFHDMKHRLDGPAEQWPSGAKSWYVGNLLIANEGGVPHMEDIGFDPVRYRAAVDIWNDLVKGSTHTAYTGNFKGVQSKFFRAWDEWLRDNQKSDQYIEPPDVSTLEPEPEPSSEINEIFKGWRTFLK